MKSMKKWIVSLLCATLMMQTVAFAHGGDLTIREEHIVQTEINSLIFQQYTPNEEGKLTVEETFELSTYVVEVTPTAALTITPTGEEVWVYIEYLTDLDNNGVYESTGVEHWYGVSHEGEILPASSLTQGITEVTEVSTMSLVESGLFAEENYKPEGSTPMEGMLFAPQTNAVISLTVAENPIHLDYESVQPGDCTSYFLCVDYRNWSDMAEVGAPYFDDVKISDWFWNGADYTVRNGYLSGTGKNQFSPGQPFTRAMALQVLYRHAGAPGFTSGNFDDVSDDAWYSMATSWAAYYDILDVEEGNLVRPEEQVTREEFADFLYRYAQRFYDAAKPTGTLNYYYDSFHVDEDKVDGVLWVLDQKIITGTDLSVISPRTGATRGQAAVMLTRFFDYSIPLLENPPVLLDPETGEPVLDEDGNEIPL
ncbi:MAG: S-layer homology domain-containing protein [Eubacteriales bacterium]